MAAPWAAGAQVRIIGEIHGQQTVNVVHFATNTVINDDAQLNTLLLQLAADVLACAQTTLIPAVTQDWRLIKCDAKRIAPTLSDPVEQLINGNVIGSLSASMVSYAASIVSLRTGQAGRKGRGRLFLPPPGETECAQSTMDTSTQTLVNTFLTCLMTKFGPTNPTSEWRLGVLSRKDFNNAPANFDTAFRTIQTLTSNAILGVLTSRRKGTGS